MATLDEMKLARDGHLGFGRPRKHTGHLRPVGETIRVERDDERGVQREYVKIRGTSGVVEYERDLDFVGRARCGCVRAWCSGTVKGRHRSQNLREFERDGLTLERMTTEEARAALQIVCPHDRAAAPSGAAPKGG